MVDCELEERTGKVLEPADSVQWSSIEARIYQGAKRVNDFQEAREVWWMSAECRLRHSVLPTFKEEQQITCGNHQQEAVAVR